VVRHSFDDVDGRAALLPFEMVDICPVYIDQCCQIILREFAFRADTAQVFSKIAAQLHSIL